MAKEDEMAARKIIQYTEEFLRRFKDCKFEVPDSVKKSDLYVLAPKPPVNRPRVDRTRSKDGTRNKSFLSAAERQELQRRRKDGEKKKKQEELPDFRQDSQKQKKEDEKDAIAKDGPFVTTEEDTETEADNSKVGNSTAVLLQDAQEQQIVLSVPDPDGPGSANKPETRSLLSRSKKSLTVETDERRLSQRRKQIEYGKVTHGYQVFCMIRPIEKRTKQDPHTPNAAQMCSKRSWDGQVKKWRKQLHRFDDLLPESETAKAIESRAKASGIDLSASASDSEEPKARTPLQPRPASSKTPVLSKEDRDELARKRREQDVLKGTPQKAARPCEESPSHK